MFSSQIPKRLGWQNTHAYDKRKDGQIDRQRERERERERERAAANSTHVQFSENAVDLQGMASAFLELFLLHSI